jgi:hypothetical protein
MNHLMNKEQKTTFGSVALTVAAGAALLFGVKEAAGFFVDHLALVATIFGLLVGVAGSAFLGRSIHTNNSK